ncbi:MAG: tungsten-dependent formylmethanofuran dehydrogenase subunit FwdF [Methanobacteriaceae archaeon]
MSSIEKKPFENFAERTGKESRSLIYKSEKCLGCGICSDTCPTNALKLGPILPIARGLLKVSPISIDNNKCVLCGLCSVACPFDVLDLNIEGKNIKEMKDYPKWDCGAKIDEETCIYCGRCYKSCPTEAIYLYRTLPKVENLVKGETEIDEDKCIYCEMCKDICPPQAITISTKQLSKSSITDKKSNKNPMTISKSIEVDKTKCIYCGICKKICPEEAIKVACTTCMDYEEIMAENTETGHNNTEIIGDILIDPNKCIVCGWCEEMCPVDSAKVQKPFTGEVIMSEEPLCKGDSCHACQDVCPCNAISIVDNIAKVNSNFCTLCGACSKACPQHILSVKRESMHLTNIKSKSWTNILGKLIE